MAHTRAYAPALTGFRAVAALLVFLFHYRSSLSGPSTVVTKALLAFTSELHIGVSLFFTLSGYLLCRRYFANIPLSFAEYRSFLLRRFARIYPLYFLLTSFVFLADGGYRMLPSSLWWQQYGLNITLLKGFSEKWHLSGIGPGWSLTVEESFYLLLPFLLFLGRRYTVGIWGAVVVGLVGFGLGLSYLMHSFHFFETPRFVLITTFFGRSAEFLIGAAFARLRPAQLSHATAWGSLLVSGILLLLVSIQIQHKANAGIEVYPGIAVNNWLLPWGVGLLLHGLTTQPTWLRSVLSGPLAQVLGKSSYAFYLLHLGMLPNFLLPKLVHYLPGLPTLPTLCLVVWAVAIGLYYAVEAPLNRLILRAGL